MMQLGFTQANFIGECRQSRLGLWECPPFLFIVMGIVNIVTVATAYVFAGRLIEEPEVAALIVLFASAIVFVMGDFLIAGFNKIAEANRIKSEFLNLVSHQLRTPLSVFKWTLELLEREHIDPRRRNEYVVMLIENNERMIRLVNLLLDVSRIEARRFTLRRAPVALEKLTNDAIRFFRKKADKSGVEIVFNTKGNSTVFGDEDRLRMVIQNLIDNAIRYSSAAGRIAVTLSAVNGGRAVEWRIRDQGVGIPKNQQKYIFQKFFRAANGQMHQPQGTGLGLYIVKTIIAELRGKTGFESQEGKGSTFWFTLPTINSS